MAKSRAYGWAKSYHRKRPEKEREFDEKYRAEVVFREDLGTNQYRVWKADPDKYDIDGIDTPKRKRKPSEKPKAEAEPGDTGRKRREKPPKRLLDKSEWRTLDPDGYETDPTSRFLMDYRTTGDPARDRCPKCGGTEWRPVRAAFEDDVYRASFLCKRCRESIVFDTPVGPVLETGMARWAVGPVKRSGDGYTCQVFHAEKGFASPERYTVRVDSDGNIDAGGVRIPSVVRSKVKALWKEAVGLAR